MKNTLPYLIVCLASVILCGCEKEKGIQNVPDDMFRITALEGNLDVSMNLDDETLPHTSPSLLYSTDGQNWSDFVIGETVVNLPEAGSILYVKAGKRNTTFSIDPGPDSKKIADYHSFKFSKKAKVSGNIMYLLDGTSPEDAQMGELAFYGLFLNESRLMDASELLLPSRKLSKECYAEMFESTSISKAPELPATEMAPYCYTSMFRACTDLTDAPELPATKLDTACYNGMFLGCTALAEAPALPAVKLAPTCYCFMFSECTALTEAPALPAEKLETYCYCNMFSGCTALTEGPDLPASKLEPYCYGLMFSGCTSMTRLTCSATDISAERCVAKWMKDIETKGTLYAASGTDWTGLIPETWTVEY